MNSVARSYVSSGVHLDAAEDADWNVIASRRSGLSCYTENNFSRSGRDDRKIDRVAQFNKSALCNRYTCPASNKHTFRT